MLLIFQEVIYAEHGKHPKEALFYSHALPLPGFILLAGNIQEHFAIAAASQPMDLMGFQVLTWVKFLQEIIKLSIRYFPRPHHIWPTIWYSRIVLIKQGRLRSSSVYQDLSVAEMICKFKNGLLVQNWVLFELRQFQILKSYVPYSLLTFLSFQAPSMLVYLALNTLTQYICISAVFILTTECASLTVTLVLTLRKFCSLLFSIWYFQVTTLKLLTQHCENL